MFAKNTSSCEIIVVAIFCSYRNSSNKNPEQLFFQRRGDFSRRAAIIQGGVIIYSAENFSADFYREKERK